MANASGKSSVMKFLLVLLLTRTNATLFDDLHASLVKNVDYLINNPTECNLDCLLGMEFAMGELINDILLLLFAL